MGTKDAAAEEGLPACTELGRFQNSFIWLIGWLRGGLAF